MHEFIGAGLGVVIMRSPNVKEVCRLFAAALVMLLCAVPSAFSDINRSPTTRTRTGDALNSGFKASDPGVRGGAPGAGNALPGLSSSEMTFFEAGREDFTEAEGVGDGLGPRFNLDSCVGCHNQPTVGGSSPPLNPQVALANAFGAFNTVPSFITQDGPVREARFKFNADGTRDGGVHDLFVISGRVDNTGDASSCTIAQEDFDAQIHAGNVIFRIPTPVFGAGLVELIPDSDIIANMAANASQKASLGISGHLNRISGQPNLNGNDGTIARFGWKAQNKSMLLFAGEAYNVEMGITNEIFPTERDESTSCQFAVLPNDVTDMNATAGIDTISGIEKFAFFMKFLAPPVPATPSQEKVVSIEQGRRTFMSIGCALCHTPSFTTPRNISVAALSNQPVNLYSDLAVHGMGDGLADDVVQGSAGPDEFRTAPLWGLGQRIFFLHDGRATNLIDAIQAHKSSRSRDAKFRPSEANGVVDNYSNLNESSKQDLLNFLRSL